MSIEDESVREHLLWQLRGGHAHMTLAQAVVDFPMDRINEPFLNGPYGAWALLEHIRVSQWDILDFSRNSDYKEMKWPEDYWPDPAYKATAADWQKTMEAYEADRLALEAIVQDPKTDLYAKIAHGDGQTILREVILTCDHLAYHLGEFAIMRQVMSTWPADRKGN